MKYAIIGCGRIAANHLSSAIENHLDIVGLCDLKNENINLLLNKCNAQTKDYARYADYREMLSACTPDLVAIATESGKHTQIALDCIDMGCNLIIEKPITLSLREADEIINRARKKSVKVCSCHQNRFNTAIQKTYQALKNGEFGVLSHGCINVRWSRNRQYYEQAPWRGTWSMDGGALMNQSIHGIDLLRWTMGDEIEEVFAYIAQRQHHYLECEDIGIAIVKFKNGAIGTIEGTTNIYPQNLEETLCLFGSTGTVRVGGMAANKIEVWNMEGQRDPDALNVTESIKDVYGNGHFSIYKDMVSALLEDRSPYVDAEAGRRALELVLAIYKSAAEGVPVKLPLKECSTMDFRGLFSV